MLELEPARADAEDRAAALTTSSVVIAFASRVGLRLGLARHQGSELYAFGRGGERAESRVRLEHRLVRSSQTRKLIEVIDHEDGVEAGGLGLLGLRDDGGEEFGDTGAVGEVGDLQSEFGHTST